MRVVAVEVWADPDGYRGAVLCVRHETGVYQVFVGGGFIESKRRGLELFEHLLAYVEAVSDPLATPAFNPARWGLQAVATEFAIEKAAQKYVRRILTEKVDADAPRFAGQTGWKPAKGWKRVYDGAHTVQRWDENAEAVKAALALQELEATIEAEAKIGAFGDSDSDFAARRQRKLALKRQKRELAQKQAGDSNAKSE